MTTDRELMQQALDALDSIGGEEFLCEAAHHSKKDRHQAHEFCPVVKRYEAASDALRARLAQPEQEPVAYITTWNEKEDAGVELHWAKQLRGASSKYTPLYTALPQREWQGLTDEEIEKLVYDIRSQTTGVVAVAHVARAIEAKLKEKNSA